MPKKRFGQKISLEIDHETLAKIKQIFEDENSLSGDNIERTETMSSTIRKLIRLGIAILKNTRG